MKNEPNLKKYSKEILEEYKNTEISVNDLHKKYHITPKDISDFLKSNNILIRRNRQYNHDIFKVIDTEEKAYWLGFLYGDGSVYKDRVALKLMKSDYKHLEKFKKFLNVNKNIYYSKSENSCEVTCYSKEIYQDLINLGCVPAKSLILTFPTENQLPYNFIPDFLRGYFEADGCISISKKFTFGITLLGTSEFLSSIIEIYNLNCSLLKDPRHLNNTNSISLKLSNAYKFLTNIYEGAEVFLDRKMEKYTIFKEYINEKPKKWKVYYLYD